MNVGIQYMVKVGSEIPEEKMDFSVNCIETTKPKIKRNDNKKTTQVLEE